MKFSFIKIIEKGGKHWDAKLSGTMIKKAVKQYATSWYNL